MLFHSLLSSVEGFCRQYFGNYFLGQLLLSLCHGLFSKFLLLVSMIEDGRHVLAGGRTSWVMVLPEHFEQCSVVCLLWVVDDLNCLGMVATEREMKSKTSIIAVTQGIKKCKDAFYTHRL